MSRRLILAVAALAMFAVPHVHAEKRAASGGGIIPVAVVTPLTAQECRDLGGEVQTVRKSLCPRGKQCRSAVRNPQTGGIDLHVVCIDEVN